jgi:putative FmdB family regulatory protein
MPIYTYKCQDCGTVADYLVKKWGQKPDGCKDCGSQIIAREWSGQTFACTKSSTRLDYNGNVHPGQGGTNLEGSVAQATQNDSTTATSVDTRLEPGIHITTGVTRDKRLALNVSRVQADGKVDTSVTGYNLTLPRKE